jgi:hypothetical protein
MKAPNAWSCGPTCLAYILQEDVGKIISLIGHDGSEILWPNLAEPGCRKGFHQQELIDVAYTLGFGLLDIQGAPMGVPCTPGAYYTVNMKPYNVVAQPVYQNALARVQRYMRDHKGIFYGQGTLFGHMCAWTGRLIVDPRGGSYPLEMCSQNQFTPSGFLALVKL